jgi:hypothetical protein
MDFKSYLSPAFIQGLQNLADSPIIKAEIEKFSKIGGLDPAIFLEICCKYLREGRTIDSLLGGPIDKCIITDLRKTLLDALCQSEDVFEGIEMLLSLDSKLQMYLDKNETLLNDIYEKAICEYKKERPNDYFGGQNHEPSGKLEYCRYKLYEICKREILLLINNKIEN